MIFTLELNIIINIKGSSSHDAVICDCFIEWKNSETLGTWIIEFFHVF